MQFKIKRESPTAPINNVQKIERLGFSKKEAAGMLGLSESMVHNLTKSGQLPCKHVGRRVLYSMDTLRDFLNSRDRVKNEPVSE